MCVSNTSENKKHNKKKSDRILKGISFKMWKQAKLLFCIYLHRFIDAIYSYFWESEKVAIPALEEKHLILTESAVSLAAKIRNRQLKSEELIQACIERIKIVNPIVNAMTDERFEAALEDARDIDQMIANGLSDEYFKDKPFLGVPFTAKESHGVCGLRQTLGLPSRSHVRAHADAECVRLVRGAGAVPLAVTNVPVVNRWQETYNYVFGLTKNPYHTGRTTGGSSGGEAALAATYCSPISLCSDIGGSTRMPAFYCGLFALNPTAGYTSLKGSTLRDGTEPTIASVGFVSRHVEDLAPLTRIVAGDQADQLGLEKTLDFKDINIFYTEAAKDARVTPISDDLRKAMKMVIHNLSETAPSTDRAPQHYYHTGFDHMFSLWKHQMSKEAADFAKLVTNNTGHAYALLEIVKKLLGMSTLTLGAILQLSADQILPKVNAKWAETLLKDLTDDLLSKLGDNGVLLFPSAPQPAPYHYSLYCRPFNFSYWALFNALKFPAVQVPLGLNARGLPLGIQVVTSPRHEHLCLTVADYLRREFGGFKPPCDVPKAH